MLFGQLSRLCKELLLLPFGLAETRGIQKVVECFSFGSASIHEAPEADLTGAENGSMVGDENSRGVEQVDETQ